MSAIILESKTNPPTPKSLTAEERKKLHEAAMKKMKDEEAGVLARRRQENNEAQRQRFERWVTTTNLDDHNLRTDNLSIITRDIDEIVAKEIEKKALSLGYKIETTPYGFRIIQ